MSVLQTISLEHLPADYVVHIAVYREVKNSSSLQEQLLAGNTEFEYALIDASVIISKIQAMSAAYRAVNDLVENRLRSRNVHSEIVFSLSPNNNIAETFRRFGITPTTTNLLVIKVSTPSQPFSADAVQEHLTKSIDGTQAEFNDNVIAGMTDLARIRKIYKLNTVGSKPEKGVANAKAERRELEMLIISSMALRGATN
ncbi:kinase binding protein CGI-121-domain-containing protein [Calycina marina]|uniref:EKC/KEOPS complex subunit CGI121 n=1 Tax=Calycina marina TaxID=1763456 RepID=A0A9P7YX42_9HELO|nr:kinase binding protein CGI-121-domain-containing protein [Calycina marina]